MKKFLLIGFLSCTVFAYGQMGGMGGRPAPTPNVPNNPFPGPTPNNPPDIFDQSPKDAFAGNPQLAPKLQQLLPNGPNVQEACDGFKKLGDCVSTIHVSQNLSIPLADLKAKVTGKGAEKLEKAIHDLKPDVDAKAEYKKAHKLAQKEIP